MTGIVLVPSVSGLCYLLCVKPVIIPQNDHGMGSLGRGRVGASSATCPGPCGDPGGQVAEVGRTALQELKLGEGNKFLKGKQHPLRRWGMGDSTREKGHPRVLLSCCHVVKA